MSWDATEEREVCDICGEGALDDLWPDKNRTLCSECWNDQYGVYPGEEESHAAAE